MISLQNKVFDTPQPQFYQLQERVSFLKMFLKILKFDFKDLKTKTIQKCFYFHSSF